MNSILLLKLMVDYLFVYYFPIFSDIAPHSPCVKQCFGGTYRPHLHGLVSAEHETGVLAGGWAEEFG
jgi:hypothetical protein